MRIFLVTGYWFTVGFLLGICGGETEFREWACEKGEKGEKGERQGMIPDGGLAGGSWMLFAGCLLGQCWRTLQISLELMFWI